MARIMPERWEAAAAHRLPAREPLPSPAQCTRARSAVVPSVSLCRYVVMSLCRQVSPGVVRCRYVAMLLCRYVVIVVIIVVRRHAASGVVMCRYCRYCRYRRYCRYCRYRRSVIVPAVQLLL